MTTEILVIREKERFSDILIESEFTVTNFPVIKTAPLEDLGEIENYLNEIESFDGIFITSVNAAEIVLAKLNELRREFHGKFYVLGKRSNLLLKNAGFSTFFSEQSTTAEELLELIPSDELQGKKILFPCGDRSLRVIPEKLKGIAEVKEVIVYKTEFTANDESQTEEIKEKLNDEKFSIICFFSPSGVEGFTENFKDFSQGNIKIAAIGKTTARFAEQSNFKVDFIAANPSADEFAKGLIEYLRKEL